jgi:hypothetical protein
MTGATMNHLTDEQIDDALLGDLAAEAAGHLAACGVCQQQLIAARMPLESFKAVTLAWSERRSATMPVSLQDRMLHNASGSRRRAWGTAAVAVLALMVALPFGMRHANGVREASSTQEVAPIAQPLQAKASAEQIDSDNQMLHEIETELSSNRTSSEAMELQEIGDQGDGHGSARMVRD